MALGVATSWHLRNVLPKRPCLQFRKTSDGATVFYAIAKKDQDLDTPTSLPIPCPGALASSGKPDLQRFALQRKFATFGVAGALEWGS